MKEYEIAAVICNACAGSGRPQTFFEEAALENPDDYVRSKHGADFPRFTKETLPNGMVRYCFESGSVSYRYEFTEI